MFCTVTSQVGGLRVSLMGLGYQFGESLDNAVLCMHTQSWSSLFFIRMAVRREFGCGVCGVK